MGVLLRRLVTAEGGEEGVVKEKSAGGEDLDDALSGLVTMEVEKTEVEGPGGEGGDDGDREGGLPRGKIASEAVEDGLRLGGETEEGEGVVGVVDEVGGDVHAGVVEPDEERDDVAGDDRGGAMGDQPVVDIAVDLVKEEKIVYGIVAVELRRRRRSHCCRVDDLGLDGNCKCGTETDSIYSVGKGAQVNRRELPWRQYTVSRFVNDVRTRIINHIIIIIIIILQAIHLFIKS